MRTEAENQEMGFVNVKVLVSNPADSGKSQEIELLVDTGATLSVIPHSVLEGLGIRPIARRSFRAFGGSIQRNVGGALVRYQGDTAIVPIIFGEEGDIPVLGVTTLESLGYQVDPITGQLRPTEMLLL